MPIREARLQIFRVLMAVVVPLALAGTPTGARAKVFDPVTFTMESAAEMAVRSVWLGWRLSEMAGRPEIGAGQAIKRPRRSPERAWYALPAMRP